MASINIPKLQPTKPSENGFNHNLWGFVVPDGPNYCHWGGIDQSKRLVDTLNLHECDYLLELCCGSAGLLKFVQNVRFACGIDISQSALTSANCKNEADNIAFVRCNARVLPFANCTFTKIVAQDADAWLHPSKQELLTEIYRVMYEPASFVFQTYACSERITNLDRSKTDDLMHACGYSYTDLPVAENLAPMFLQAGFEIVEHRSLHSLYLQHNILMLEQFVANETKLLANFSPHLVSSLHALLHWEASLFAEEKWTGLLIKAKKIAPEHSRSFLP